MKDIGLAAVFSCIWDTLDGDSCIVSSSSVFIQSIVLDQAVLLHVRVIKHCHSSHNKSKE